MATEKENTGKKKMKKALKKGKKIPLLRRSVAPASAAIYVNDMQMVSKLRRADKEKKKKGRKPIGKTERKMRFSRRRL